MDGLLAGRPYNTLPVLDLGCIQHDFFVFSIHTTHAAAFGLCALRYGDSGGQKGPVM
jgi:hypothetical protein